MIIDGDGFIKYRTLKSGLSQNVGQTKTLINQGFGGDT